MAPRRLPLLVLAITAGCTVVVVDGFHSRPALSMKAFSSNKKAAAAAATTPAAPLLKPPAVRMPPPPLAGASKPSPASVQSSPPLNISSTHDYSTCSSSSPFHCVIEDELGRPRTEARPQGDGRSWHASLQFLLAQQILADASRLRSVSKDMLQDALHYLEYVSLFGKGGKSSCSQKDEQEEDAHSLLDGTWRLAFNSGGAFPFKGARQDRWGYLKDDVEVRIDSTSSTSAAATILVEAFAKRFEGTLAPLPGARSPNTLALDFSRVQLLGGIKAKTTTPAAPTTPMLAPGELKLVNAILRPGARLHLISVAASHLALRFTPAITAANAAVEAQEQETGAAASSLLVFERIAAPPKRPAASGAGRKKGVAARAATAAAATATAPPAAVKKAVAVGVKKPQPQAPKPRFKKPLKGTPSNPYSSFFEYLEEECVPLYLVLAFPTFMKHMPHIAHAARFKLLLLQELWVELSSRLLFLPHH